MTANNESVQIVHLKKVETIFMEAGSMMAIGQLL